MSSIFSLIAFVFVMGLLVLVSIIKAFGAIRTMKNTREAQTCPQCGHTSFTDEVIDTLESSWSLYRHESRDYVRRTCAQCGYTWQVESRCITKYYPDSFT